MIITISPRLLVRDITDQFDFVDDTGKIKKIEEVYLYDSNYSVGQNTLRRCVFLYTTIWFDDCANPSEYEALYEKYGWHDSNDLLLPIDQVEAAVFLKEESFEDVSYGAAFNKVAEYYRCDHYY